MDLLKTPAFQKMIVAAGIVKSTILPLPVTRQHLLCLNSAFLLALLLSLGLLACAGEEGASGSGNTVRTAVPEPEEVGGEESGKAIVESSGPCALTPAEVSEVLNEAVTEVLPQGKWGVASSCTYSTATSPAAVGLSSVKSADLSTDRLYEGHQEIAGVGDEAVWIPAIAQLTVVDQSKNQLLRIGIDIPRSKEERLEIAKKLAALALARL